MQNWSATSGSGYEYNSQQPEDKKIHAIGIDIEFSTKAIMKAISLLEQKPIELPEEWKPLYEKAVAGDVASFNQLYGMMYPIKQYEDQLRDIFGDNYDVFMQIMKSFEYVVKISEQTQLPTDTREEYDIYY